MVSQGKSVARQNREGPPAPEDALLAIDIGNTQVVLGVFEGEELKDLFRLTSQAPRTGDDLFPIVEHLIAPFREKLDASKRCVIGSVVPAQTAAWEAMGRRLFGRPPLVASVEAARDLKVEVLDPASIGIDRVANAVAAADRHRLPAIVVDLGTATTFDVVLPGPRYLGGAIAPGIMTSADELFRRAARLPKVEIRRPAHVLGRTTEECIQSGIFFGAVGQIDSLVRGLIRELKIRPLVLATGGLAEFVAAGSETIERVDPGLTLHGLRLMEEGSGSGRGSSRRDRRYRTAASRGRKL